MPISKVLPPTHPVPRGEATRQRVLEAAEHLLRQGRAEFSMRDLASEAGVSFATPFNQFGSKGAIMQALSARRIEAMAQRFARAAPGGDAADRVLAAVGIAAAVMLAEPEVNRAVIGSVGAPGCEVGEEPGQVRARSRALWAQALGDADGLDPALAGLARSDLPDHLAVAFRGVLSFWTAGEVPDAEFAVRARAAAAAMLLGFVVPERRGAVVTMIGAVSGMPAADP